jgi:hypothetical protein
MAEITTICTMMTKEFEQLIIEQEHIQEAKGLAYDLGYAENYPYGITNPTYYEEMAACITALVGLDENGRWPDAVEEAYKQGSRDGWWDS